ncbi:MAG: response regulator [bacterium]|nr:response regulator [bacterium]
MNKKKIYVIDDSSMILNFMQEFLSNSYEVRCFDNGTAAIAKLKDGDSPDLIICDCRMPNDLSGSEVLKAAQVINNELPFILLSGNKDIEQKVEAFQLGALDFVEKPFNPLELDARIKRVLDLKSEQTKYTLKYAV